MEPRSKRGSVIAFLVGGLLGGISGYILHDLLEKGDAADVREMCQQYCEQDEVDQLFDSLEQRAREGTR